MVNTVCSALLCIWYQRHPHLHGLSVWGIICRRALLTLANLYLHFALRRGPGRVHRSSRPSPGTPGSVARTSLHVGKGKQLHADSASGSASDGTAAKLSPIEAAGEASAAVATVQEEAAAVRRRVGTQGALPAAMQAWSHDQTQPAQQAAPPSPSGADPLRSSAGGANEAPAALRASAPAQPTNAEPPASSAPGSGSRRPPPRYAPFLARSTHLVKLPGHSPDQLAPGWEDRLREAVAARGRVLAGAYVRAGCIELVVETVGGTGPQCGDGDGDGGERELMAAVVRALALPPTADAEASAAAVRNLGILHGAFPPSPRPHGSGAQTRISPSLTPRVALLPPGEGSPGQWGLKLELAVSGLPEDAVAVAASGGQRGTAWREGASGGRGADNPAAVSPALGCAGLEVLVRVCGRYLPARVTRLDRLKPCPCGALRRAGAHFIFFGPGPLAQRIPPRVAPPLPPPSPTQVDVRLGGVPCCALPVLVLPAGEGELAAELRGVEADAEAGEAEVEAEGQEDALGDLLYDIGAMLYGEMYGRSRNSTRLLAAHLLVYAEGAGLKALAATVRDTGGDADCGAADVVGAAAAAAAPAGPHSCAPAAGFLSTDHTPVCCPAVGGSTASAPSGPAPPREPSARRRPPAGCVWSEVRSALLLSAGLAREGPGEAEDFRAAAADWAAGQAHIIQTVELLGLLALPRCRPYPRPHDLLLWLLRLGVSIATAAAWPLLPPLRWRRLAVAARGPRYLASVGCKALMLALRASFRHRLGGSPLGSGLGGDGGAAAARHVPGG